MSDFGPGVRKTAFRYPHFVVLWLSVLVSQIGDQLQLTARGWLVLEFSGSPAAVGYVAASGTLPQIVFFLVGGVFADRFRKPDALVYIALSQTVVATILAIVAYGELQALWIFAVLAFLLGALGALWQPIYLSLVPELVPRSALSSAMGLSLVGLYLSRTIGPGFAGILVASFGVPLTFLINTASFLLPLVVLLLVRTRVNAPVQPKSAVSVGDLWTTLVATIRDTTLRPLLLLTAWLSIGLLPVFSLMPVFVRNGLGLDAMWLGVFLGVAGVGQVLGAMVVSALPTRENSRIGRTQLYGYIAMGVSLTLVFVFVPNRYLSLVAFALFNAIHGFLSPRSNAIVQFLSDDGTRGRVQGLFLFTFSLVSIGQVLMGGMSARLPMGPVFIFPAMILAVAAIVLLLRGSELSTRRWKSG